jgi:four helix bundle protein
MFDHEKLDVYRISLDFAAWSYNLAKRLKGADRHAGVQLLRASQSIPLTIAEGNGKRSAPDRKRYFQIAWLITITSTKKINTNNRGRG